MLMKMSIELNFSFFSTSDRFRTMINVLGDALAAGIMAHLCKKDFEKATTSTTPAPTPPASNQRVRKSGSVCNQADLNQIRSLQSERNLNPFIWKLTL